MTTIATDGRSMAGDGLSNYSGIITSEACTKVFRLADGRLLGCCGPTSEYERFREWIDAGADREKLPKIDNGFQALICGAEGIELWEYDGTFTRFDRPMAIGSGMPFALAAMDCGHSPERAIEIASTRCVHTGGKITVLHLDKVQMRSVA